MRRFTLADERMLIERIRHSMDWSKQEEDILDQLLSDLLFFEKNRHLLVAGSAIYKNPAMAEIREQFGDQATVAEVAPTGGLKG